MGKDVLESLTRGTGRVREYHLLLMELSVCLSRWMGRGSQEMQGTLCTPSMTHIEITASWLPFHLSAVRSCRPQKGVNKALGVSIHTTCLSYLSGPLGMEIVSLWDAGCDLP